MARAKSSSNAKRRLAAASCGDANLNVLTRNVLI
jgi:hypothetical protein